MKEIKALVEPSRLYDVIVALRAVPSMPAFTVSEVRAFAAGGSGPPGDRKSADPVASYEMYEVECVAPAELAGFVLAAVERTVHAGLPDRERVIVRDVEETVKAGATQPGRSNL